MMDLTKGVGRYDLSQFKGPSAITQGGATMRGAFTGLGDKVMGAIAEPGLKRESDAKTAKIQEFVTKYNNPNDAYFSGMQGSQRALTLSRLLLPLDPAMSEEWSKRSDAMAQEEKSRSRDLETLKARESGLTDRAKIEQEAKTAESAGLKAQQELAMQKIKEASELWSKNKEDQGLQTMLTNAVNDAKTVRLSIPNPIETWIRDKASTQGADQRQQSIELQKSGQEFNQEMQRENSKRDNEKLALEKAKFAKEAKAESEKLKGSALDSTSIAQLSNLKTVLTSIAEIKTAFEKFQNASSVGEKYEAIRDLKGSALLGSENLGRVQSGGAIQAEELATFKTLMSPSTLDFVDGGASYLNNVAKLEASINGKIGNFATKGRSLTGGAVQSVPVVAPSKTGKMRMIK